MTREHSGKEGGFEKKENAGKKVGAGECKEGKSLGGHETKHSKQRKMILNIKRATKRICEKNRLLTLQCNRMFASQQRKGNLETFEN